MFVPQVLVSVTCVLASLLQFVLIPDIDNFASLIGLIPAMLYVPSWPAIPLL